VTSTTSTTATLAWDDNSNNETGFATQYRVGSGPWVAGPTTNAGATSITVGGLNPGIDYTFQVGAQNSAGTKWSAYAYGTTTAQACFNWVDTEVPIQITAGGRVSWGNQHGEGPLTSSSLSSYHGTISYGDGASEPTVLNGGPYKHTYNVAGTYKTRIVGDGTVAVTGGSCHEDVTYTVVVSAAPPPPQSFDYQVTNYDADGTHGVYLRNSSNVNDVNRDSAHYVLYGTTVTLLCGGWGSPVGPHNNTAWDYVRVSDGRTGWLSEHWLNTPVGPSQHVPGEPSC